MDEGLLVAPRLPRAGLTLAALTLATLTLATLGLVRILRRQGAGLFHHRDLALDDLAPLVIRLQVAQQRPPVGQAAIDIAAGDLGAAQEETGAGLGRIEGVRLLEGLKRVRRELPIGPFGENAPQGAPQLRLARRQLDRLAQIVFGGVVLALARLQFAQEIVAGGIVGMLFRSSVTRASI